MSQGKLAAPELAGVEVEGVTRSSFILRGALAAGTVYGAGTVGPFVRQAFAQGDMGDVDVLNFALTLEYLESDFYQSKGMQVGLSGEARKLAEEFGKNEQEHVDALKAAVEDLGGKPVREPRFRFSPARDQASFLKLAQTLEDTGVSAYNGAAPAIKSKAILGSAGAIVQVEARHAAAIRLLNEESPAPDAFDKSLEMQQVLKAVKPFIAAQ